MIKDAIRGLTKKIPDLDVKKKKKKIESSGRRTATLSLKKGNFRLETTINIQQEIGANKEMEYDRYVLFRELFIY